MNTSTSTDRDVIIPIFDYDDTLRGRGDRPIHRVIVGSSPDFTEVPVGYQLYADGRMNSGTVVGRAAAGKTTVAEGVAASAGGRGHTQIWAASGYDILSPRLHQIAERTSGGNNQVKAMISDAVAVLTIRMDPSPAPAGWMAKLTKPRRHTKPDAKALFTPSHQQPGLLIVLDDAQPLLADADIRESVRFIGEEGDRYGVAILATLHATHVDAFGDYETKRALTANQTIAVGNFNRQHTALPVPLPHRDYAEGYLIDAPANKVTAFNFHRQPAVKA